MENCFAASSVSLVLPFFSLFFFLSFLLPSRGVRRGGGGRGLEGWAGTGGVGGEFGEVFPCLGWPLYGVFLLSGGKREAVYTNNRLRTGTDKGNPTV